MNTTECTETSALKLPVNVPKSSYLNKSLILAVVVSVPNPISLKSQTMF